MTKILVVEDDPVNAMVVSDYLQAHGYDVRCARTGTEGVELFGTIRPDMMIVDVMLPRKSGFEVCFEVKRTDHGRTMPLVFMSAVYRDEKQGERYAVEDLHADAFLVKPFDLSRLLGTVRQLVGEA